MQMEEIDLICAPLRLDRIADLCANMLAQCMP